MVDDVVAKRVWKFDSGLCKKIPVLNFSKKSGFEAVYPSIWRV